MSPDRSIELKKNGSVVFTDQRENVTFVSFSPNGPLCSPVCQQTTVML